jgi:hypothetical protein
VTLAKLAAAAVPRSIIGGSATDTQSAGDNFYHPMGRSAKTVTTEAVAEKLIMPRAGVIKNLRARNEANNGAGVTVALTVTINGVASTLTAAWAAADLAGTNISDLVHAPAVAAGDTISILVNASGASNCKPTWSLEWEPT